MRCLTLALLGAGPEVIAARPWSRPRSSRPVFALLIFGILEFGLTFRDYLTVANASRDGARAASAYGDDQYADYNVIQVVRQSSKGFRPNEIRRLIIFNAGAVGGSVLTPSAPRPRLPDGHRRHHRRLQRVRRRRPEAPKSAFGCLTSESLDRFWCPAALNGDPRGPGVGAARLRRRVRAVPP